MSGVDVLAVLDDLVADMGNTPGTTGQQVEQVRAAVGELIDADEEFDNARKGYNPLYVYNPLCADRDQFDRYQAAEKRRAKALARCRGGAA